MDYGRILKALFFQREIKKLNPNYKNFWFLKFIAFRKSNKNFKDQMSKEARWVKRTFDEPEINDQTIQN